jgi:hypothetical protein
MQALDELLRRRTHIGKYPNGASKVISVDINSN